MTGNLVRVDYKRWYLDRNGDWDADYPTDYFYAGTLDQAADMVIKKPDYVVDEIRWATDEEVKKYQAGEFGWV